jgi:endonuclease YncB( thermonuclease family)
MATSERAEHMSKYNSLSVLLGISYPIDPKSFFQAPPERGAPRCAQERFSRHKRLDRASFRIAVLSIGAIVASASPASAQPFSVAETVSGPAVAEDGDTLCIAGRRVRLASIDAPETRQMCERGDGSAWPCGRDATDAMTALVQRRTVTCQAWTGDPEDSRGRMVGVCTVGGRDVGATLLERGLAIAVPRFTDGRPWAATYLAAEARAKREGAGMWSGRFISPSTWRAERFGDRPASPPRTRAQRSSYGSC